MDKIGVMISIIFTIVRKINSIICGNKRKGKKELCIILLKYLYLQKSLDGIDFKGVVENINRKNKCDLEKIFRFNNLSSELRIFLYTHDNIYSNYEMRVLNNLIAKRKGEINNLFIKQTDSAVKKYIEKNIYCFWGLFFLTYGSAWVNLLSKGIKCSYPAIVLLTIIYFAMAALLILVPDCLMWVADRSKLLGHGGLVHFLELKYNQYSLVKSFFDYHTKEK